MVRCAIWSSCDRARCRWPWRSPTRSTTRSPAGRFRGPDPDTELRALFSPVTEAFMVLTRTADWVVAGDAPPGSAHQYRRAGFGYRRRHSGELLAARAGRPADFGQMLRCQGIAASQRRCATGRVDAISFVAANPVPLMQEATFSCDGAFRAARPGVRPLDARALPVLCSGRGAGRPVPEQSRIRCRRSACAPWWWRRARPRTMSSTSSPAPCSRTWPSCARCIWRSPISGRRHAGPMRVRAGASRRCALLPRGGAPIAQAVPARLSMRRHGPAFAKCPGSARRRHRPPAPAIPAV